MSDSRAVAVGILTHNSARYVDGLVASLRRQTRQPHRLFAVDNASTDETVRLLRQRGVEVHCEPNLGVGAGHTKSILTAFSDPSVEFVLLLEHDCFLAATCIERLLDAVLVAENGGERVGAFACQVVHPEENAALLRSAEQGRLPVSVEPWPGFTFNGLLLPWTTVAIVGFPRSDFFVGQEDNDYYRRMSRMGVPVRRAGGALVAHYGKGRSRRSASLPVSRRAYSKRNSTYREAMFDDQLARAVLRLGYHGMRAFLTRDVGDRFIARAVRDGWSGRLGMMTDEPLLETS